VVALLHQQLTNTKLNSPLDLQWKDFWEGHSDVSQTLGDLQTRIGYQFKNLPLLYEALTHRSAVSDFDLGCRDRTSRDCSEQLSWNERLEFLGDSVLGLVITTHLWQEHESFAEGELSRVRASLVNEATLAQIARELFLGESIALGKGETKNGGRTRDALLADAMEALIGAVYLDGEFASASVFVLSIFSKRLRQEWQEFGCDFKTQLQELAQDVFKSTPNYQLTNESGPDHAKEFEMGVYIGDRCLGHGVGANKKSASQEAAKSALQKIVSEISSEKVEV
jgi:ribonuclease-3